MTARKAITRRWLPHWYVPGAFHFVTFRLRDTLPTAKLEDLRAKKAVMLQQKPSSGMTPVQHRINLHKQLFGLYDAFLDQPSVVSWLADPRVAAVVRSSLYFLHGSKYHLLSYCIMPNHVHVLFQPIGTGENASPEKGPEQAKGQLPLGEEADSANPLSSIMHSLKSYTAHEANKILGRKGSFWQSESYDHWVRDEVELERIVNYIADNPVKAGLVTKPHEWFFCSSHDRFLVDGELCGWLRWEK